MKKATISIDQPNRPKGELIEVPPIGLIPNGSSIELDGLTEKQAAWLATGTGMKVKYGGKTIEPAQYETKPEGLLDSYLALNELEVVEGGDTE